MGLVRDGTWYGTSFTFYDVKKQMSDEFSIECSIAAGVVNDIGVDLSAGTAFYFMPEKDSSKYKSDGAISSNKAVQGLEEHEEVDYSQDVSLPQ